jgi:hydrogenase expression/formation protein HypD
MGLRDYPPIAERHRIPVVVTGFEPIDLLDGIRRAVTMLERGEVRVENAYARAVTFDGNVPAQRMLAEVFELTDRAWRGLGRIANSGWRLTPEYRAYDAALRFGVKEMPAREPGICRAGEVLRGTFKPNECAAFGATCTPRSPVGAPMVSSEGACAAYYHYGRFRDPAPAAAV